jgi:hypothetical protein
MGFSSNDTYLVLLEGSREKNWLMIEKKEIPEP